MKAESLHNGPACVAGTPNGVGEPDRAPGVPRGVPNGDSGVVPGAAGEPNTEKVGMLVAVGGGNVALGAARAVWVSCTANCAETVCAASVKINPTSAVGSGCRPRLQPERISEEATRITKIVVLGYCM